VNPWTETADSAPVREEAVGFGDYGQAFTKFTEKNFFSAMKGSCGFHEAAADEPGRGADFLGRVGGSRGSASLRLCIAAAS
jgi:hypothetical protein